MTDETKRAKEVILEHLKQFGYPNVDPDVIIRELPKLWFELDKHSLTPPDMSFEHFCQIAHTKYFEALIKFGV